MTPRIKVLLNEESGRADKAGLAILAGFQHLGFPCELIRVQPDMNITELARNAAVQPDTIVVSAGGDGTVSAVAAGVVGTRSAMGVIPLGTLNHFAKDLGIPLKLDRALQVIAQQHRSLVDTGEVNGHTFINNSSVGSYPITLTERVRLEKKGLSDWLSLAIASIHALVRFHCIVVQLTVHGESITRHTPILFIGNNEYRMEGTRIGTRDHLDRGTLFVYVAPRLTRLGTFRMALAALFGKVEDISRCEPFSVTEITVDLHHPACSVSLDGEVRRIRGPLRYRIRPASLYVFTPHPV